MPRYFVSYIEQSGHSSMVVSELVEGQPHAKIITQLGFAHSPDEYDNVTLFSKVKGFVREEQSISHLVYGRSNTKHRTYEISSAELSLLYNRLNEDRRKNLYNINLGTDDKELLIPIGGPDYAMFSYNCKNYVLDVLYSVGIVDINSVKNFWVQQPGFLTRNVSPLKSSHLFCPDKDEYIKQMEEILKFTAQLANDLRALAPTPRVSKDMAKTQYWDNIIKLEQQIHAVQSTLKKAGFEPKHGVVFKGLYDSLKSFVSNNDKFTIPSLREQAANRMNDLNNCADKLSALMDKTMDDSLTFFWRNIPKLSPRVNFANFKPREQVIYGVQLYISQSQQSLEQILEALNSINDKSSQHIKHDVEKIKELVELAKLDLTQYIEKFITMNQNGESYDLDEYRELYLNFKYRVEQLERNINNYQPANPAAGIIKRTIAKIMQLLGMVSGKYVEPNIAYLKGKCKPPTPIEFMEYKFEPPNSLLSRIKSYLRSIFNTKTPIPASNSAFPVESVASRTKSDEITKVRDTEEPNINKKDKHKP